MQSVKEMRPIPAPWNNSLSTTRQSSVPVVGGADILCRRYETLSRLSRSLTLGSPQVWMEVLTSELQPALNFDFLDVVVFSRDGAEVVWSLRANERKTDNHLPMQETLFWCVYHHQKPLWIEDSDADQ